VAWGVITVESPVDAALSPFFTAFLGKYAVEDPFSTPYLGKYAVLKPFFTPY
jgi:hypothetical protein